MVDVPRYRPQVGIAEEPGIQVNPPRSSDPYGARAARAVIESAGEVTDLATQIVTQEAENADNLAAVADELDLSNLQNSLLYDPQNGAMSKRGKAAFGVEGEVKEEWDKQIGKLAGQQMTERRRNAFNVNAARRAADMKVRLGRFVSGEIQRYDNTNHADYMTAMQREAMQGWMTKDAVGVDVALAKALNALTAYRDRNANDEFDDDWLKLQTAETTSTFRASVVDQMLAHGAYPTAKKYLEKHGHEIVVEERTRLQESVRQANMTGAAIVTVDDIMADKTSVEDTDEGPRLTVTKGAQSERELIDAIRNDPAMKDDPALLQHTLAEGRARWAEKERLEANESNANYMAAVEAMRGKVNGVNVPAMAGRVSNIPAQVRAKLTSSQMSSINAEANAIIKAKREGAKTETPQYAKSTFFYRLALDPGSPAYQNTSAFKKTDPKNWNGEQFEQATALWSEEDRDEARKAWFAAINKATDPKAKSAHAKLAYTNDIVMRAARQLGGAVKSTDTMADWVGGDKASMRNPDALDAYNDIYDELEKRRKAFYYSQTPHRDPNDEELDKIVNDITTDEFFSATVKVDGKATLFRNLTDDMLNNQRVEMPDRDVKEIWTAWRAQSGNSDSVDQATFLDRYRTEVQHAWRDLKNNKKAFEYLDHFAPAREEEPDLYGPDEDEEQKPRPMTTMERAR